jgi:hypothetical protein
MFKQTSYHNLYDIWTFSRLEFPLFFTEDSNPCMACHNPHLAKRNKGFPRDPSYTAISRPTDHAALWGDGASETMDDYTPDYQAPFYSGSTTTYEPDGTSTDDGSLTPDYNTFCMDCHNSINSIWSTALSRTLRTLDWGMAGDVHGKRDAQDTENNAPYTTSTQDYVLSCLDCHEPHGSNNVFLLRRGVNGGTLSGTVATGYNFRYFCARCHDSDWRSIHHSSVDHPYNRIMGPANCTQCHGSGGGSAKDCEECHYHGAVISLDPGNPSHNTPPNTRYAF